MKESTNGAALRVAVARAEAEAVAVAVAVTMSVAVAGHQSVKNVKERSKQL